MKAKTKVKAGGLSANHNEKLIRRPRNAGGLKVRTNVRAGGARVINHNQTLIHAAE